MEHVHCALFALSLLLFANIPCIVADESYSAQLQNTIRSPFRENSSSEFYALHTKEEIYQNVQKLIAEVSGLKQEIGGISHELAIEKKVQNLTAEVNILKRKSEQGSHDLENEKRLNRILNSGKDDLENQIRDLKKSLKKIGATRLKQILLSKDHITNPNDFRNDTILVTIFENDPELFQDVINEFVNDEYGKTDTEELMVIGRKLHYIKQQIYVFVALFDKLKSNMNDPLIGRLAVYIKEVTRYDNYPDIGSVAKNKMEYLKNNLPKSLSTLVFASKLCIKNVKNGEYLYSDDSKFDDQRRNVYTSSGSQTSSQNKWELAVFYNPYKKRHFLSLKSTERDEYLEATKISISSNHETCNKAIARIGGAAHYEGDWDIFPFSNGFKIKSAYYDDSFLTTCGSFDSKNVVATSADDNSTRFIWQIEEC